MFQTIKNDWFSNVRGDVLSGIVVALALIPEAIAFSVIAGVDPTVGLYAAFCIAVTISFVGGRTGMISAATGAMALLMVTAIQKAAYSPTVGSTPAITEKAIASGINAKATTIPDNTSPLTLENQSFFIV